MQKAYYDYSPNCYGTQATQRANHIYYYGSNPNFGYGSPTGYDESSDAYAGTPSPQGIGAPIPPNPSRDTYRQNYSVPPNTVNRVSHILSEGGEPIGQLEQQQQHMMGSLQDGNSPYLPTNGLYPENLQQPNDISTIPLWQKLYNNGNGNPAGMPNGAIENGAIHGGYHPLGHPGAPHSASPTETPGNIVPGSLPQNIRPYDWMNSRRPTKKKKYISDTKEAITRQQGKYISEYKVGGWGVCPRK